MRLNIIVGQTLTVKCSVQIIWGMRERIQHHHFHHFLPSSSVVQGSNSEGVWGLERMAGEGG